MESIVLLILNSIVTSTDPYKVSIKAIPRPLSVAGTNPRLDRTKFFNVHDSPAANNFLSQDIHLLLDYNVNLGRTFAVSGRASMLPPTEDGMVDSDALAKSCKTTPPGLFGWPAHAVDIVVSSKTEFYFPALNNGGFLPRNASVAADFWSQFLKLCSMPWQKRIICEVMNEPNVKVQKCNTTWDTMIDYHITIATRIHNDLKNSSTTYLVGGPTSAFPEDEAKNFTHFRNVLKPFIDKAGKHVDYLSIHLYDTMGLDMDKNPLDFSARSGNNVDAILDLHEGYTSSVIGKVLPHSISEFGTGFKSKSFSYSAVHDWYILRGVVAKVMQFMQRPDRIIKAIPFIVGKATWFKYEPDSSYPFVLWRATSTANGVDNRTWYPTQLHKFYEFFAHVTGCSFYVKSSDANIQVNMFYDDDTGVTNILLNNLKNVSASISIPLIFTNSAIIWQRRRLFFDAESQLPVIEVSDANKEPLPVRVLLAGNEATILTINGTRFSIGDNLLENTHYSSETLVKMISNEQKTFSVPVKSVQLLQATLRVGFSVPDKAALDTKLLFSVSVNNISVPISLETDMGGLAHLSANSGEVFGSFRVDLATAAWTSDNIWLVTISCARSGFISSVVIVTVSE